MLQQRSVLFLAAFVIAQAWIPQQQACDKRSPAPTPSPGSDPWANLPITDTITTADGVRIGVQVLLTNLQIPWSLAFAPDGRLFFTERVGRIRDVITGPDGALYFCTSNRDGRGGAVAADDRIARIVPVQ